MSTDTTWQVKSSSGSETERLGELLGQRLKGGEVIELTSDLGGGKTTFTRGLARGAKSTDHVASPTFTISKIYKTDRFSIYHFDFYRLQEAGLIEHEISDYLGDEKAVIVIEWSEVVKHILPKERLKIELKRVSDDERELTYVYPSSLEYLVKT